MVTGSHCQRSITTFFETNTKKMPLFEKAEALIHFFTEVWSFFRPTSPPSRSRCQRLRRTSFQTNRNLKYFLGKRLSFASILKLTLFRTFSFTYSLTSNPPSRSRYQNWRKRVSEQVRNSNNFSKGSFILKANPLLKSEGLHFCCFTEI